MGLLEFSRSRRGGELIGIVILAVGISLGAALITYHSDDASAFHSSTNTVVALMINNAVVRYMEGYVRSPYVDKKFWQPAPLLTKLAAEGKTFN